MQSVLSADHQSKLMSVVVVGGVSVVAWVPVVTQVLTGSRNPQKPSSSQSCTHAVCNMVDMKLTNVIAVRSCNSVGTAHSKYKYNVYSKLTRRDF